MRMTCWIVLWSAVLCASGMSEVYGGGERTGWTSIGPDGGQIHALALDPTTPTTLYAGTFGGGVFKSTDGAATWSPANSGLPANSSVAALALDPTTPTTLYAGIQVLAPPGGVGIGVYKSTDGGATWRATGLVNQAVGSLALDLSTPTTLYAAGAGVYKSPDGGATWSAINTGLPANSSVTTLALDQTAPTTLYVWTRVLFPPGITGAFKSIDGGATWSPASTGLSSTFIGVLALDPTAPTTLYAAGAGVFKSTDGAATWSATGLVNRTVSALVIDPTAPTTLYAGTSDGAFKSPDGATTWSAINTGLPTDSPIHAVEALALDPTTPTTLYAGIFGGVYKSTDGGGTWNAAGRVDRPVEILMLDPTAPSTLYAGIFGTGVFKSPDGGGTWNAANTGLSNLNVYALVIDPRISTTLYAGTQGGGVFRSPDGGGTWGAINAGLPADRWVTALAIGPTTVYAGTNGRGVFAMPLVERCHGAGTVFLWGRVTRAGGLRGVPGVTLMLEGPDGCTDQVATGALGFFVFSQLDRGAYTLTPSQVGCTFNPPSQEITLAGQHPRVHFIAACP